MQHSPTLGILPCQETTLSAVTANGLPLQVSGTIDAEVEMAHDLITHKFYIADDITGDGILGMDFLKPLRANVDLEASCSRVRNAVIPLQYTYKEIAVARVILQENTVIPANHEVVFSAKIDLDANPGGYEGFIEPNADFTQKTDLLVGRVLAVSSELHAPVRLLNLSNLDVTLYRGMHIGTFFPLQHVQYQDNVCMVSAEPGSWKEKLTDSSILNKHQKNNYHNCLGILRTSFPNLQQIMGGQH